MNILAVDTTFETLSLCLIKQDAPVANYYLVCRRRNSTLLFQVLDELLRNAEMALPEIDLYVVTLGPGSYTGVRIGMGLMKTLALVHDKPLVGVNSLQLLASLAVKVDHPFGVVLNCTRAEVFYAQFQWRDGSPAQLTPIQWTTVENLPAEIAGQPVILKRISAGKMEPQALFQELRLLPCQYPVPDAYQLSQLGRQLFEDYQSRQAPLPLVQPLYIKKDV